MTLEDTEPANFHLPRIYNMSEVAPAPNTSNGAPSEPSARSRRRRRPNGGGGNNQRDNQDGESAGGHSQQGRSRGPRQRPRRQQPSHSGNPGDITGPTSLSESAMPSTGLNTTPASEPVRRQPRGRGRGNGGTQSANAQNQTGSRAGRNIPNQRGSHSNQLRTIGGRRFGGQLTVEDGNSQLNASAAEFRPNQQSQRTTTPKGNQVSQPKKRRLSKSSAPDISTRIHEDVENGHYECAICTNEILRNSKVWSCRTCWTVFHLTCIKKWSTNQGSTVTRQEPQNGDIPPPRQWRCPGCNLPKETLPTVFTCWCEKELDPKPLTGLPPFSCGQTCARAHILPKKCPHPCPSICHAGPCPPCSLMGPPQSCFCGKESATRRCTDTNYEKGWTCGQICGELMPCGEHYCDRPCHEGLCGACEIRIKARCYCGQEEKDILCCDRGDENISYRSYISDNGDQTNEEWVGLFKCGNICERQFDCGKHRCQQVCHAQEGTPTHCPRSPDVVTHCPCGKTEIRDLSVGPRKSCEDPIPNCNKPCRKLLSCGHECEQLCHSGECPPCFKLVTINCRCGRISSPTICHQGCEENPQCTRTCRSTLNCGRHECGERCCPGERKAVERQSSKRKQRPLTSAPSRVEDNFEAEHICTRPCGRSLKCGNHLCQDLCHKGPCGSCREAIFDEISCHCGRTVLQPPLPCGTRPPPCRFQCERPKSCGHPQVPHSCHLDGEFCPKCPFLTEKDCMCGKQKLKNIQCWLSDVRCGQVCGRKLKCGAHKCQKQCHRPGECEDAGKSCQQACGKEKSCGHPCSDPCHSPYTCKEDKACLHKIFITCECQRIKQETKCNASKGSEGNCKKVLKCDDECARLERNRKLALALNIDPATRTDDHIPYSTETLNMYQQNIAWSQTQEKEFRLLAADKDQKRLRFKPMPAPQRSFLHHLAEDFGFDSESLDPEPHRHVAIFKTPRFVMAPMKTLAECARLRNSQRATATIPIIPTIPTDSTKQLKASNVVGEPYNGYLMTNVRFALTIEELRSVIKLAIPSQSGLTFDISFLPNEEVVFRTLTPTLPERQLEALLASTKPVLSGALRAQSLGSIQLCRLDSSLNILRSESDSASNGGWSQVAAKAAAPVRAPRQAPLVGSNSFTVLSLSAKKKKASSKLKKEENVADDWEAAEMEEEEKEKAMASSTSGDEMAEEKVQTESRSRSSADLASGVRIQDTLEDE